MEVHGEVEFILFSVREVIVTCLYFLLPLLRKNTCELNRFIQS
jgi:hypothetical protein